MSRRFFSAGLNRIRTKSHIATSQSRAERSQRKSERFLNYQQAIRQRRAARHERYLNAFKRAGSAFRMWWLMLLGVMSKVVRPIVGAHGPVTRRAKAVRRKSVGSHAAFSAEGLESRQLLTAVLDPTFDLDGKAITDFSGDDRGAAIVVDANGKIFVAGSSDGNFAIARYHVNGQLDTSFGDSGKVTADFGADDGATSLTIDGDGKIVVAGYTISNGISDFALARFNANGTIDETFGSAGMATLDVGSNDGVKSLAIADEDKIVVAGYSNASGDFDFALARFDSDGSIDDTFGSTNTGIVTLDLGNDDVAESVAITGEGKIVVAGYSNVNGTYDFALARFGADGLIDATFGGNDTGIVTNDFGGDDVGRSMSLGSDGRIVVAGHSNEDFALAQFDGSGIIDSNFGIDGRVTSDFGAFDRAYSVAIRGDGRIVAAGYSDVDGTKDFALVQYEMNGSPDTTFGVNGMFRSVAESSEDEANGVSFDNTNRIIVAGSMNNNFAVVRVMINALPDINAQSFSVAEDDAGTSSFATVLANDVESAVTFAITGGTGQSVFSINPATGALTSNGNLNFEVTQSYTLEVEVTDYFDEVATALMTINLADVNESLVSAPADTNFDVNEVSEDTAVDALVGITAFATDADGTTNTVTYSLVNSSGVAADAGGLFKIDASTGVVSVNSATLNFESATSHEITVRATSQDGSVDHSTFAIQVLDVNEYAVTAASDNNTTNDVVAENAAVDSLVGITAVASDDDGSNNVVSYSLQDASNSATDAGGRFKIDPVSGVVSVATSDFDYEQTTNYSVTVRATSADGSKSHTVFTIAVSDIDEFDVTTPVDDDAALNSVAENAVVDTVVGITALATDDDGTTNTVTYSLVSDAGGLFKINSTTGVVSVASAALDFETATSFDITVRATSADTSTSDATFTINVLDFDESDVTAPVDTDGLADSVAENVTVGTPVGIEASASDADGSNNTITYSLESASGAADAGGRFQINSGTGVVTVAVADFNYEAATSYTITVKAASSDGSVAYTEFTIAVTDVNEKGDLTLNAISTVLDKQDTSDGVVVGSFSTSDPDDADSTTSLTGSGAHVLSFTGGDAMYFTVEGTNIKFNAGVLNELTRSSYTTTLRLVDGPYTIDRTITVDVLSLQEQINNANSGDTLTVIPGDYSSISVTGPKTLTIIGDGVTIYSASPALTVDNATVSVSGMTYIDISNEDPTPAAAIIVRNGGSLTIDTTTVIEQDTQTTPLISVEDTSTLDVSSGDNVFESSVSGTGFIAAASGATVTWDAANELNITTNEDAAFVIDARVDGSDIVNLFTSPATNGSVIINVDGTLTYTPAADFYGTATFDFETADGATGTVNVTVRPVNDQPTFDNGSEVIVYEDDIGTQEVVGQINIANVVLGPANETDGVAHGTFGNPHNNQSVSFEVSATNSTLFSTQPAIDATGKLTFVLDHSITNALKLGETAVSVVSVTLNDGGGTGNGGVATSIVQMFEIRVTGANDAPVAVAGTNSGNEDATLTGSLVATDVDHDAVLTFAQVGSVAGLTINTDGTYRFDASDAAYQSLKAGETLVVTADYSVTDENSESSSSTLTITLTGANDNPVAVAGTNSGNEDTTISGSLVATDVDHDAVLTFAQVGSVAGLTINGDGTYSFDAGDAAYQNLKAGETLAVVANYSVSDENSESSGSTLTITLTGTNDAPIAVAGTNSGNEDATLTGSLVATDVDHDAVLTFAQVGSVAGLTINTDGTYSFDASDVAYQSLKAGETLVVTADYSVTDENSESSSSTLTITLTGTNDAPVAVAGTNSGNEDATLTGSLVATDVDHDAVLTFAQVGSVAGLVINGDGTYSFDASDVAYQSLKAGETLVVVANYSVTDENSESSGSTLTITLTGTNDAPVAVAGTNSGNEDATLTGSLVATDVDHDAVLTFAQVGSVAGLTINTDGTYRFDASDAAYQSLKAGETLVVTADYSVTDENSESSSSTLTITLTGTNDNPVAVAGTNSGNEDATLTDSLVATDVDHDAVLTFAQVGYVAGLTINTDGTYSFDASDMAYQSLKAGQTLVVVANYNVTDEHGATATSTLTITVTGTNDDPIVSVVGVPTLTTTEDATTPLTITGISVSDIDEAATGLSITLTTFNGKLSAVATASVSVSGSGSKTITLSGTAANLNSFLAMTGIDYTPDADYNSVDGTTSPNTQGAELLTVVATDDQSATSTAATKTITVTEVNDLPSSLAVASSVNEDSTAGVTIDVLAVATEGPAIEIAPQTVSLIGGGSIAAAHGSVTYNLAAGTIKYTPTANSNYYGLDTFSYRIRDNGTTAGDAAPLTVEITVTITINPVNDAPTFAILGTAPTVLEDAAAQTLTGFVTSVNVGPTNETDNLAHGPFSAPHNNQNATRTYVVTNDNIALFAVQPAIDAAGNLTYQVAPNANGSATVSVVLNDGGGTANGGVDVSSTQTFTISVTAVNDVPVATDGSFSATEDEALNGDLYALASDVETPDASLTYTQVGGPLSGLTLNTDGTFSYLSPTSNFNGTVTFQYKVSDGVADSATKTVTINVAAVNDAPVADDGTFTATEDVTLSGNLYSLVSDVETADASLTYTQVGGPLAGLTLNSDGTFSYLNPTPSFNGTVTFQYKVSDGALESTTQTVTINVDGVNDAPVITNNEGGATATLSAAEKQTAVTTVTATDIDVPAQTLTYSISGGADAAMFSIDSSTGVLTFNSAPNFESPTDAGLNNVYDVEVTVTDNGTPNLTDVQLISVTVTDVNEAPTAITLSNIITDLDEFTSVTSRVRVADLGIADDVLGTNTLSLSGADAAVFEIVGSSLYLKAGTALNAFARPVYAFQVNVTDLSLGASPSASVSGTLSITTQVPTILSPPASSVAQRPVFAWSPIAGAAGYEITIREYIKNPVTGVLTSKIVVVNGGSGNVNLANFAVTGTSYTPPSDLGIGQFKIWVRSVSSTGVKSRWTAPYTFNIKTAVTLNAFPTLRQLTPRPTVTWQPLPGAVKYDVWIDNRTNTADVETQYIRTEVSGASFTPDTDLPIGRYRVWVRGIDERGLSRNWSAWKDFVVAPAPTPVVVSSTFDKTPTFEWSPVEGAVSYNIVVSQSGSVVFQENVTTNSFTPSADLTNGGYGWKVQAVGTQDYITNFSTGQVLFVGGRPTLTEFTGPTSSTPTFTWLAVQGVGSYQIRIDRTDIVHNNLINVSGLPAETTSFTPTTSLAAGTYRFWIRAFSANPAEGSSWSLSSTFTVGVAANDEAPSADSGVGEAIVANLASQLPKTIAVTKQQDQQADGVTSESDVIVVQAREKVNATVPMPTEPVSQTLTTEESLETSEATLMDLSLIDIALSNAINEGLLDQVFEGRESV